MQSAPDYSAQKQGNIWYVCRGPRYLSLLFFCSLVFQTVLQQVTQNSWHQVIQFWVLMEWLHILCFGVCSSHYFAWYSVQNGEKVALRHVQENTHLAIFRFAQQKGFAGKRRHFHASFKTNWKLIRPFLTELQNDFVKKWKVSVFRKKLSSFHPRFWRFAPEPWPCPPWKCDPPRVFWGWGNEWMGSLPLKMAISSKNRHIGEGEYGKLGAYTVRLVLSHVYRSAELTTSHLIFLSVFGSSVRLAIRHLLSEAVFCTVYSVTGGGGTTVTGVT